MRTFLQPEGEGRSGRINMLAILMALLVVVAGLLAWFFYSQQSSEQPAHTDTTQALKIVVSVPLNVGLGESIANAVTLALEERDYRVGDQPIELLVLDDGDETGAWLAERESDNAMRAAGDSSVIAYIGPYNSGAAKVSMPILNQAGIVQISPGNTWPGLTKPGYVPGEPGIFYPTGNRHYVRVVPTDDIQGPAAAIWAGELGFDSVYVLDDGEAYGKGVADLFVSRASQVGINVIKQVTINKVSNDFSKEVQDIIAAKPDFIYYGGVVPNGITKLLQQLRAAGSDITLMGPDGIQAQDFIQRVGTDAAYNVYATNVGVPISQIDTVRASNFRTAYLQRFEKEPEVFSAFGYEAALVVLHAIDQTPQHGRADILNQVFDTRDFDGLLGSWSFTSEGDTTLELISGHEIIDGQYQYLKTFNNISP